MEKIKRLSRAYVREMGKEGCQAAAVAFDLDGMRAAFAVKMDRDTMKFALYKMCLSSGDPALARELALAAMAASEKMGLISAEGKVDDMLSKLNLN